MAAIIMQAAIIIRPTGANFAPVGFFMCQEIAPQFMRDICEANGEIIGGMSVT